MKKRLKFIFLIALLTAGGIVVFQCFWICNAYRVAESNFYTNASAALQQSIDLYQLGQSGAVPSKTYANHVSVFVQPGSDLSPVKPALGDKQTSVEVSPVNMQKVQLMMTRLMSQLTEKTIELDKLKLLYKAELKKRGIYLSFVLSLSKKNTDEHMISGYTGMSSDSAIVHATFSSQAAYFLWMTLFPVSISFLLILLTAGCLYYMLYVIRKQVQLDDIKNDFINNMTHELKTPVAILKSTHEALDKFGQVADKEKTLRYLHINETVLNKLEANIDRILDITRYEQGKKIVIFGLVQISEFIEEVLQRFRLNDNVQIDVIYDLENQTVITDKHFLEAIISNLVDNAIKYSGESPVISICIGSKNDGWAINIADNGIGIAPKDLPHIFDKFYRVPNSDVHDIKGFGLGLNYVRELVSLLNGKMSVQSEPGKGSVFTVYFQDNG